MAKLSRPRSGTLQFYPRKRISKFLPRVNWAPVNVEKGLGGFIVYKAGMSTALVKDTTDKSMTLNKDVAMPVTILEAPPMKLFSIRFYKHGVVVKDLVVSNDKELKKKLKVPKTAHSHDKAPSEYDDIQLLVYSVPKHTSVKKTPDLIEVAIGAEDKLAYAKSLIGKELSFSDFSSSDLLDVRGLTTGKGLVGPVKRFGITLKAHKSEKGVRRPGSLAPWHPARVTFRTPMAGQLGLFTRITYNLKLLASGKISEKNINPKSGFPHYGNVKTSYVIVKGSVQGPAKRQLLITPAYRPSREQAKKKYELLEVYS